MSEELVKRLRAYAQTWLRVSCGNVRVHGVDGLWLTTDDISEAADTIEALQARIAQLEAELAGAREAALEEAAKVARDYGSKAKQRGWTTAPDSAAKAAQHIASNIRALAQERTDD
jgi:hypothetical protein